LLLPENYDDWSDFDTYSDLLLFEMDLGYLTSAVLVFLESPGAIAELGAFSQISSLGERLIVVVTDNHHPKKSFISLGPIRSIKETQKYPHSVCVIPNVKPDQFGPHIPVVVNTLDLKRGRPNSSEGFKSENIQHQILLILDLVNLFSVIQISELQILMAHFGKQMSFPRLNQILYVLEKVGLIIRKPYGNNEYFLPGKFRKMYVDYTSKTGARAFNRGKAKALIWGEIQKDQFRKNVHELVIKDGGVA